VAFERLLADLSARMANVPADRVEPEIQLAQVIHRQFLGFDRSTFAEFQDDNSLVVVSSTAIEGVDPTPLGPLPPSSIGSSPNFAPVKRSSSRIRPTIFRRKLSARRNISGGRASDLI
jgi:hypothetical protein